MLQFHMVFYKTMKSAIFTGICLCLLFLSISCSKSKFEDFNLLLISIDTVRADHLGCYGYSRGTSPTLDRLSREGILFTSHYSHAPTTAASHMTIFTSVYPSVHQIVNWDDMKESKENTSLSPQITTLAEILNNAGYNSISYNGGG